MCVFEELSLGKIQNKKKNEGMDVGIQRSRGWGVEGIHGCLQRRCFKVGITILGLHTLLKLGKA